METDKIGRKARWVIQRYCDYIHFSVYWIGSSILFIIVLIWAVIIGILDWIWR